MMMVLLYDIAIYDVDLALYFSVIFVCFLLLQLQLQIKKKNPGKTYADGNALGIDGAHVPYGRVYADDIALGTAARLCQRLCPRRSSLHMCHMVGSMLTALPSA
jgi:hypothetical protein